MQTPPDSVQPIPLASNGHLTHTLHCTGETKSSFMPAAQPLRILAVSALLAALGACGGGERAAPLTAEGRQQVAALMTYCKVTQKERVAERDQSGMSYSPNTSIYSWGDSDGMALGTLTLSSSLSDFREASTATYSVGTIRYGSTPMGVQFPSILADQSVGCVKPVSVTTRMPGWAHSPEQPIAPVRLSWQSRTEAQLPVDTLPGSPVDGFEFAANFTPVSGLAYFSISKSSLADASATQICHLSASQSQWQCTEPTVEGNDDFWLFSTPAPRPGVYMLVSTHAQRGA